MRPAVKAGVESADKLSSAAHSGWRRRSGWAGRTSDPCCRGRARTTAGAVLKGNVGDGGKDIQQVFANAVGLGEIDPSWWVSPVSKGEIALNPACGHHGGDFASAA